MRRWAVSTVAWSWWQTTTGSASPQERKTGQHWHLRRRRWSDWIIVTCLGITPLAVLHRIGIARINLVTIRDIPEDWCTLLLPALYLLLIDWLLSAFMAI